MKKYLNLVVQEKKPLEGDVYQLILSNPSGNSLPSFTPGSHIEVQTPNGLYRHYSLIGDGKVPNEYQLGIKKMANGRGGSIELVDDLQIGQEIQVSLPENFFALENADEYLFIAGGIGITPILSMIEHLRDIGHENFHLIYCTRSLAQTPYLNRLQNTLKPEQLTLHHDEGSLSNQLDFWPFLAEPKEGLIYCCGPSTMMEDIKGMTGHWEEGTVRFEDFGSSQTKVPISTENNAPFDVRHAASGNNYHIPADQTILESLREQGISLPSSCESGTCGTCLVRLVEGEADHRDFILDSTRQQSEILICISRSKSSVLVLDW
jgi:phthalate 4,5-dioxygenase reductase subunit